MRLQSPPPRRFGRPPGPPPPPPARLRQPEAFTWRQGLSSWRLAVLGNEHFTVVIGVSLAAHEGYMLMNALALLAALPVAALLAAAGGWLLSARALRPVRDLTETAESITARGLDQRLATANEDAEFARLIECLQRHARTPRAELRAGTRFSADAAHELKTPLTILQGELEQAVQEGGGRVAPAAGLRRLLAEVQRLETIVRKLLLLSLADAGRLG